MDSYPFSWKFEADRLEIKVRLFIFTIIGACAGLPALVWSVSDLIHHRKNGHRISVFIILLLLTDFVELFLSPYILLVQLINDPVYLNWTTKVFWFLLRTSRFNGLLLNQLVALEGILSVKYPLYTASVFSSPCFIIFYILVCICIYTGYLILEPGHRTFIPVLVLIVSVITWIISAGAPCSAGRLSHTSRKTDRHIVVVFIFNLLVLYLPFISFRLISSVFIQFHNPLIHMPLYLIRMRLISDPLLCVLVCRQNSALKGLV